ncbi:lipocalin-like domain-containing protein [Arenibaculum sp.]|jgi:hypothetical protein|uniref:lipocalin-like domain-containing protein n=1 Tax=Arenibaculum sp. TaxID=2865862 RepID=UPI002E12A71E|nr:lipocalin-like domain-containing protein [Arenibaculum sp.]
MSERTTPPARAAGHAAGGRTGLVATWRLVGHLQEVVETGEKEYPRGHAPQGFLTYTADGRFSVVNVPGGRAKPKGVSPTDEEALALFKGLTAYAGRYSVDGDKVVHHVEVSWNETWTGTDQERRFKLDGDALTIVNGPILSPWDGRRIIATMTWRRVQ